VGVIMQRDYQSLLDHLGSGKDWDMSRRRGGLRMLPPFGLPEYHTGEYTGTIEALNAVSTYIHGTSPEEHVVIMPGSLAANLDLGAAIQQHLASGAELTAVCCPSARPARPTIASSYPTRTAFPPKCCSPAPAAARAASLEVYII
jgi:glucose-1-phosphate adenylyltransferase